MIIVDLLACCVSEALLSVCPDRCSSTFKSKIGRYLYCETRHICFGLPLTCSHAFCPSSPRAVSFLQVHWRVPKLEIRVWFQGTREIFLACCFTTLQRYQTRFTSLGATVVLCSTRPLVASSKAPRIPMIKASECSSYSLAITPPPTSIAVGNLKEYFELRPST